MPSRRPRKAASLALQLAEMSVAVPQVVAHRVTRMALAGHAPSARDTKEFALMVDEKKLAFTKGLTAMAVRAARTNQAVGMAMWKSMWLPAGRQTSVNAVAALMQQAAVDMWSQGVAPVHRAAVGNARRLARTRLR